MKKVFITINNGTGIEDVKVNKIDDSTVDFSMPLDRALNMVLFSWDWNVENLDSLKTFLKSFFGETDETYLLKYGETISSADSITITIEDGVDEQEALSIIAMEYEHLKKVPELIIKFNKPLESSLADLKKVGLLYEFDNAKFELPKGELVSIPEYLKRYVKDNNITQTKDLKSVLTLEFTNDRFSVGDIHADLKPEETHEKYPEGDLYIEISVAPSQDMGELYYLVQETFNIKAAIGFYLYDDEPFEKLGELDSKYVPTFISLLSNNYTPNYITRAKDIVIKPLPNSTFLQVKNFIDMNQLYRNHDVTIKFLKGKKLFISKKIGFDIDSYIGFDIDSYNDVKCLFGYDDLYVLTSIGNEHEYMNIKDYERIANFIMAAANKADSLGETPFEKAIAAFDIARGYNLNSDVNLSFADFSKKGQVDQRTMAMLYSQILIYLGIPAIPFKITTKDGEKTLTMMNIDDPVHLINGLYFSDPSASCKANNPNYLEDYKAFAKTIYQVEEETPDIIFKDYDYFKPEKVAQVENKVREIYPCEMYPYEKASLWLTPTMMAPDLDANVLNNLNWCLGRSNLDNQHGDLYLNYKSLLEEISAKANKPLSKELLDALYYLRRNAYYQDVTYSRFTKESLAYSYASFDPQADQVTIEQMLSEKDLDMKRTLLTKTLRILQEQASDQKLSLQKK